MKKDVGYRLKVMESRLDDMFVLLDKW